MLRYLVLLCGVSILCNKLYAQHTAVPEPDSSTADALAEVIVIAHKSLADYSSKPLNTLDGYLEKGESINMIKRGAYAWEPFINGMASERSVITIDGMRIYAACTDKMDPTTSYVEITNLSNAKVHSASTGSSGGATIAGSLDLVRKKGDFSDQSEIKGSVFSGFESNNLQKIAGAGLSFANPKFFADVDFTYRDAENYKAGGRQEVLYSQFTKYNLSMTTGYRINDHQQLEASLIYDQAKNVGYPALTMDVDFARALIGSVAYIRHHITPNIKQWETKLYYNNVAHRMDDTKRPVVPIRMDMPGWSATSGFYTKLMGEWNNNHKWSANLSGHRNRSLAEMTMFSNNPNEKDMFMLTWPGVMTSYADLYLDDALTVSDKWSVLLNAGLGFHNNTVDDTFGLASLQIFYPQMAKDRNRLLKRASATAQYKIQNWKVAAGVGYEERAPSVSEGYGFYLFNSFDRFDYIGNPDMRNEKSVSFTGSLSYINSKLLAKLHINYFHISDYIIGRPDNSLSVMTIGADGVKIYEQLAHAQLFNSSIDINYQLSDKLLWSNRASYRFGQGAKIGPLPLMQPFSYSSGITFNHKHFATDINVSGASKQNRFNPEFGERSLPSYAIINWGISQNLLIAKKSVSIKVGIENILDKKYSTFADWNRIPRMGRNIYVNLIFEF